MKHIDSTQNGQGPKSMWELQEIRNAFLQKVITNWKLKGHVEVPVERMKKHASPGEEATCARCHVWKTTW